MLGKAGPRGWKWLGWDEVRWTEVDVQDVLLFQAWRAGVDVVGGRV